MTANRVYRWERGFTLVESLVVIVIMGLMLLIAVPALLKTLQTYRVSEAANQMAVHIRFVRNACLQRKINFRMIVNNKNAGSPNTYNVLYDPLRTNTFQQYPYINDVTLPPGVVILDSVAYANPTATINFTTRGSADAGDINLQGADTTYQYKLDVKPTGAVTVTKIP